MVIKFFIFFLVRPVTKVKSGSDVSPTIDKASIQPSDSRRTLYKIPCHSGEASTSQDALAKSPHQYIEIIRQDVESPGKQTSSEKQAPFVDPSTSLDMEVDEITEDQVKLITNKLKRPLYDTLYRVLNVYSSSLMT